MTEREQQQVARINELSALARTSWLALLAYLGYIGITLLAVQDADFFVPFRQTELPLVGIAIPTFSFFVFAPPLGAALYIYLHIHLLKLFDALAAAPPRIDGEVLGDRIHPWLANDLFLTMRADGAASDRPLRSLSNIASRLLVWVAAPLVLAGFWWRSMPAHEEWLTLLLALSLLIATYAGLSSWWSARSAARRSFRRPWPKPWRGRWRLYAGLCAALVIVILSWLRTEGGFSHYANLVNDFAVVSTFRDMLTEGSYPNGDMKSAQVLQEERGATRAWIPKPGTFALARTDLAGVELVALPKSWRPFETARSAFRERWCRREGLSMAVCGHLPSLDRPPPVTLAAERANWCAQFPDVPADDCLARFDALDQRFEWVWDEERSAMLAKLPTLDLAGRDLRRIYASAVSLVNADLRGARLEGAYLIRAQLEGASLIRAQLEGAKLNRAHLEGADLRLARLEGADLVLAQLEGANLSMARLDGADLLGAKLEGANLFKARMEGADLVRARLEGAYLKGAKLEGASLFGARLEGADLLGARLEGANLNGARLEGADLEGAKLEGARMKVADLRGAQALTQAQLDNSIGNADTLLPVGLAPDTNEPYYIWSCWEEEPPNLEPFVPRMGNSWRDYISMLTRGEEVLCGDRPRERTGTPLARGAPYPEGHPLEDSGLP